MKKKIALVLTLLLLVTMCLTFTGCQKKCLKISGRQAFAVYVLRGCDSIPEYFQYTSIRSCNCALLSNGIITINITDDEIPSKIYICFTANSYGMYDAVKIEEDGIAEASKTGTVCTFALKEKVYPKYKIAGNVVHYSVYNIKSTKPFEYDLVKEEFTTLLESIGTITDK